MKGPPLILPSAVLPKSLHNLPSAFVCRKKGERKVRNETIRIRIEAVPRVVSNNTLSEDKSFIEMGVYQN